MDNYKRLVDKIQADKNLKKVYKFMLSKIQINPVGVLFAKDFTIGELSLYFNVSSNYAYGYLNMLESLKIISISIKTRKNIYSVDIENFIKLMVVQEDWKNPKQDFHDFKLNVIKLSDFDDGVKNDLFKRINKETEVLNNA